MSFNCSAQISVASASRSGQRAPTGVAVPPAGGVGRAAARSASSCTFRRHGRLGLQPVGRGQVRLHPRYARRGFPGARRRSASSLGPGRAPGHWPYRARPQRCPQTPSSIPRPPRSALLRRARAWQGGTASSQPAFFQLEGSSPRALAGVGGAAAR